VQKVLARQVDVGCVLDGELVVWTGAGPDFDALQHRMVQHRRDGPDPVRAGAAGVVHRVRRARDRQRGHPATRWTARRGRLESLAENWQPYPD
jgi:hypothetical protein